MKKEMKPILFNGEMVRAVREGRKTQTRIPIRPQPDTAHWKPEYINKPKEWRPMIQLGPVHHGYSPDLWCLHDVSSPTNSVGYTSRKAPSQVGDILYVKETWWAVEVDEIGIQYCVFDDEFREDEHGGKVPNPPELRILERQNWRYGRHPNIHMPKWAARIFLEVTEVRCERIRDILEIECIAEGVIPKELLPCSPYEIFADFWKSLYPGSWERNDWVWVRTFKRIEQ